LGKIRGAMVHWIFPKARIFPDLPARATKSVHFARFNVVDPGYAVDPGPIVHRINRITPFHHVISRALATKAPLRDA